MEKGDVMFTEEFFGNCALLQSPTFGRMKIAQDVDPFDYVVTFKVSVAQSVGLSKFGNDLLPSIKFILRHTKRCNFTIVFTFHVLTQRTETSDRLLLRWLHV